MNYILECTILEITEKTFRDQNGENRAYYLAQVYQPGVGVDTISITKEAAGAVSCGKNACYTVEIVKDGKGNAKPRIICGYYN